MGRWAKKAKKATIKDEIYDSLTSKFNAGKGRDHNADKATKDDRNVIYTERSYRNYMSSGKLFVNWIKKNHPECKNLKNCRQYVDEWIGYMTEKGYSPFTIASRRSAMVKIYGAESNEFISGPPRFRKNIKNNRDVHEKARNRHISEETEKRLGRIVSAIGCRRQEFQRIHGTDVFYLSKEDLKKMEYEYEADFKKNHPDKTYVPFYTSFEPGWYVKLKGKGGKVRYTQILGENDNETIDIVNELQAYGSNLVMPKVHNAFPEHYYRSEYAKRYYNKYKRDVDTLTIRQLYYCRKDKKGIVYDRRSMLMTSRMMGHNRIDVIAGHYL